jgi:hypothetical protein
MEILIKILSLYPSLFWIKPGNLSVRNEIVSGKVNDSCLLKCIIPLKGGIISGGNREKSTSSIPVIPGKKPWQRIMQGVRAVRHLLMDIVGNEIPVNPGSG